MDTSTAYRVGSRVAHPVHGAGTIVGIQEKSIGELSHKYYVIRTHRMELMVPVTRADELGLRPVRRLASLRDLLSGCCEAPAESEVIDDYKARQAAIKDHLKSGALEQVAFAVRVLYYVNSHRKLGIVDSRLYDRGINILASELALASDRDVDEAKGEIDGLLARMLLTEEEEQASTA